MVSHCPSTSKAITERSDENGCDSKYRYHCMRTKQGSLTEQCLEISWIQDGNCAIYNTDAKRVDAEPCNENLGICPQKQYLSNDVTSYSACVNDPEVHVSSLGSTSYVANVTTPSKSPSDGSRYDRTHMPSILVAVSALIAVIAIIVIIVICMYRRRKQSPRKRSCLGLTAINRRDGEIGLSNPEEGIPLNKQPDRSGKPESTIEDTRNDIEPFYKTRTYEYVEKQLGESAVSILIIGNPGIGKSVLAEMLHNNFCGKEVDGSCYNSQRLNRLEDVFSNPSSEGVKMIYVIDDCFEDWIQYPHLVSKGLGQLNKCQEEIVKGKGNSLVITISKWNFDTNLNAGQIARLKQCDKLELVDLSGKKFKLDITDKTGILEYHRKKEGSNVQRMDDCGLRKVTDPGIMKGIVSYLSADTNLEFEYPLSSQLFYSHERFAEQKEEFFMETKRKLREYVKGLYTGSSEEKNQYCTLIYVTLNGGQVQEKKRDLSFLKDIAKTVNISLHDLNFNWDCCLLTQGNDNTYEILHEEITKLLFASFGYVHTAFVIDRCAVEVLLKYMRTTDYKRKNDYYQNGYLILTHNTYDFFAKRHPKVDEENLKHIIFMDEVFARRFRMVKKGIQKA